MGKVWGTTRVLLRTPAVEIHALRIHAGATCSWHKHDHKYNAFHVSAGQLAIDVEKTDYPLTDRTTLGPGEITTVKPGEYHRFVALTDVEAIEVYYLGALGEDIVRRDVGRMVGEKRRTPRKPRSPARYRTGR